MSKFLVTIAASLLAFTLFSPIAHGEESPQRTQANKLTDEGNYKEAFDLYQKQLTETDDAKSFAKIGSVKEMTHALPPLTHFPLQTFSHVRQMNVPKRTQMGLQEEIMCIARFEKHLGMCTPGQMCSPGQVFNLNTLRMKLRYSGALLTKVLYTAHA